MTDTPTKSGGELFIVDNSDEHWKAHRYLHDWCDAARAFDIATGYFEIGSLLSLDGEWQKLDKIRILMGDEVSKRTKKALLEGVTQITSRLDQSIEAKKEADDFLTGVPAIVEALRSGKIQARVFAKKKFHAKAYITHAKLEVLGSFALVGSSNFTYPGLHDNVELNIQVRTGTEVEALQEWYERYWDEAEDVTPELLTTIERHTRAYTPFEVYARAMAAYFRSHEVEVTEWEEHESKIYPMLDHYQSDGYHRLMEIAKRYRGALLCDGVGLGKTYVGLMVIERLLRDRKRVALLVPKAAREDVWEVRLREYLPEASGDFANLVVYNHTDLLRGSDYPQRMQRLAERVDAIVIDEAHHFRNIASQRARKLFEMTEGKDLFLLTATPINNSLYDLMHLIELFSRRQPNYFSAAPLGIHTLRGHFRRMEDALDALVGNKDGYVDLDLRAAEEQLAKDDLFRALVVQRSRAYVKRSLQQRGGSRVTFPHRQPPQVGAYSLVKTYGRLLDLVENAFDPQKRLLSLPIYFPLNYPAGEGADADPMEEGRQRQVVGLIRTLLLKRFESSAKAFESSCERLLLKLLYFVQLHAQKTAQRWQGQHAELLGRIRIHQTEGPIDVGEDEEELDEDLIPEEFKKKVIKLDGRSFNITEMVMETILDMDQLAQFLGELAGFVPAHDDKLQRLIRLLQTDSTLSTQKVLIFTEFMSTARYLENQLRAVGISPLNEVDSRDKNRSATIRAFAPYYNGSSSAELADAGVSETRVLISTDVLAEGLNLQDATCIINYDLHWNPVRLMQRIGRVDRRLDPQVEKQMIADHPDLQDVRGTVRLWNFLPPDELNQILSLWERVTHKTLRISKTFGIEGRQLLTPEDDYEALRDFNEAYEGTTTSTEEMYLAYQKLMDDHPDLADQVADMPLRVFSGKDHLTPGAQAVFFCYRLPAKDARSGEWSDQAGFTRWYLYDLAGEVIKEDATRIHGLIESVPDTPRRVEMPKQTLIDIRKKLDAHVKRTYLRRVQAPVGVKSTLLAWMELV